MASKLKSIHNLKMVFFCNFPKRVPVKLLIGGVSGAGFRAPRCCLGTFFVQYVELIDRSCEKFPECRDAFD